MAIRGAVQNLCQMFDACQHIRGVLLPISELGRIQEFPSVDDGVVSQKIVRHLDGVKTGQDHYNTVFKFWDLTVLELFKLKEDEDE